MKSARSTTYSYIGSLLACIAIPAVLIYFSFLIPGMNDEKIARFIESPVYLLGSLMLILVAPVVYTIYSKRKGQSLSQEYVNITIIRYIVAYLMFFYGFGKIGSKFFEITYLTQDTRVADLDSFFLTWFYFGKSNTQEVLIGLMELIPAILLLFRRTTFIGAVMMLPVALNVLMINVFNHISGLTFPISILISACNCYLL